VNFYSISEHLIRAKDGERPDPLLLPTNRLFAGRAIEPPREGMIPMISFLTWKLKFDGPGADYFYHQSWGQLYFTLHVDNKPLLYYYAMDPHMNCNAMTLERPIPIKPGQSFHVQADLHKVGDDDIIENLNGTEGDREILLAINGSFVDAQCFA
jgi:hypothetical protein